MNSLKKQQGMATILLVLLIGLTVMIITSTVARTLVSNKEANVAAHAQTNVQLMGWAGVSAFREYLIQEYKNKDLVKIVQLKDTTVKILDDTIKKNYIDVKIIEVKGCTGSTTNSDGSLGTPCIITADVSSKNTASQSATTIRAVYDLASIKGKTTEAISTAINFSGTTFFSGTTLSSEAPSPVPATLNVYGGDINIEAGFKLKNISLLTINAKKDPITGKGGDVHIDCSVGLIGGCGTSDKVRININAEGNVYISNSGYFGDIKAGGKVTLQTNVTAQNIQSFGDVELKLSSRADNIESNGNVTLTESASAKNIHTNKDVTLRTNVETESITTQGAVRVSVFSKVNGNIKSGKDVEISNSTVSGNIYAIDYVELTLNAKVAGSVYAKQLIWNESSRTYKKSSGVGYYNAAVRVSASTITGNVYANGDLSLPDGALGKDVLGSVYLTGTVRIGSLGIIGDIKQNQNPVTEMANFPNIPVFDFAPTQKSINDAFSAMTFETRVDVRVYKNDANYIFTRNNGVARVFLNHLKNENSQITYMYDAGKQYAVDKSGVKTLVNEQGFYLGKYVSDGKNYVGAICQTIQQEQILSNSSGILSDHKSGYCSSDIIGYLPRVSVGFSGLNGENRLIFGWPDDYDFTLPDTWYIRSTEKSSLDNASFAPGILYFEGKLIISGKENIQADSMSTTFTNTFLAEGSIDAIALSPRIYSPFNITRGGKAELICSRDLASVNGSKFTSAPPATTPLTLSNKFLTPVNLCKDRSNFLQNTNKESNGSIKKVLIDNKATDKLDLGLVALMSNKVIRIGTCARIYGDVLARSSVEGSVGCGITDNKNEIVGNISSQGIAPTGLGIQQQNTMGAGTNIVLPSAQYTNAKNSEKTVEVEAITVDSVNLQWSKYL